MQLFKARQERKQQEAENKQRIAAAEPEYQRLGDELGSGDPSRVSEALAAFRANESLSLLPEAERARLGAAAFRRYADSVLVDDILSAEEDALVWDVMGALGINLDADVPTDRAVLARLMVAKVNDGRLETLESPRLLTKPGEVVHLEVVASLLKEVAIREWQGGVGGLSFPVTKGVRYRTGRVRGRSVVVGTEVQVEDDGVLSISSQRAAFMGSRKTFEIPHAKLLGMQVFSDGILLQSSSRQQAVKIGLADGYGEMVAATLNAAVQAAIS